ncbi:4'-phosphopantetheinyl transferase superfamily protein [Streptomyces sp. ISL-11]|uniref:4'-phosphopantetheinyl transferase family protein n=1 Tax=Streptomyces sp. ISL-11 TaxID=2819174 RepID=UPI001BEBC4C0|nr:4'-phosphopantetheinyl transferase superfamily protein [Streptomyces sp. ISL-11]MBT2386308.1 4'-phosphopantetheinyl transferase superfamily protein [Streptomyces sp. ISL-11]
MRAATLTRPAIGEDQLHLWLVATPRPDATHSRLDLTELDEAERTRTASFIRPSDGATYATAHIALRRLLGAYLHQPPAQVAFVREPCPGCGATHGRPAVAADGPPLHFSLSHSHGMVLIAVAARTVGADVERLPRAATVEVCTPALHPKERAELQQTPEEARPAAFGQLWTRKEAFLKGIGTGLSRSPAADYLGADPARRPTGWTIADVPAGPRHHAAVALTGPAPTTATVRLLGAPALLPGATVDLATPGRPLPTR